MSSTVAILRRATMRRLLGLLSCVVLLTAQWNFGGAMFFCKMSGRVQPRCCCKSGPMSVLAVSRLAADGEKRVDYDDCCERRVSAASAERTASLADILPPFVPLAVLLGNLPVPWIARIAMRALPNPPKRARSPPVRSVPKFILHLALLS